MRSSNDFQDVASSPQMDMRSELPADAISPMDLPQPCERSACDQDAGLPASDDMLVFEEPLQVTAVDLPFAKQEPFSNAAGFYSLLKTLRSSTSPVYRRHDRTGRPVQGFADDARLGSDP